MENYMKTIGQSLSNFQAALNQNGSTFEEYIKENYSNKWISDNLYYISRIRTTFVNSIIQFLADEGLVNLERVMMSIMTDPLAHDIEHTPSIPYKGHTYVTTHSMIYCKFLACSNPRIKGIFVDSPNIRLELESPNNVQRGKYIIDFSQIDVELRRDAKITLEEYYGKPDRVREVLDSDMTKIKNLFERMIVCMAEEVNKRNADDLKKLGVVLEVPKTPFPSFAKDKADAKYGNKTGEMKCGEEVKDQFYWITGLYRENYDLVYPYLHADGSKPDIAGIPSENIFNYDICVKGIDAKTGKHTPALEILSGGIREWLYETVVERIIDNRVLPVRPVIKNGNLENVEDLGGYGPFLQLLTIKNAKGESVFPATMGGGIGVERTLYALLRGEKVRKIDDVTFFGKNPDSHPLYLF
ncbi:MAG: hypothetical protein JW969_20820 [Spirochaetales bacterium]|nr:hypothetical protein [Spirochaetales bacterium]